MKKLFVVFLLIQVGLFAQVNNTNKWIMRGDDTKLSFAYSKGPLTNDTLIFVVKATKDITEIRLIEKTTYNSQISLSGTKPAFIFVTLEAGDTDDLTLARYFYDITRIHNGDTTTIIIGDLYIQPDIGTPFDGTDVTGRVTTVSLNNGTTLNSVIVWDTTNQYWKPMSFSTFESLINVSPGSLPDSVLFSSDTTDQRTFSDLKYVDKTTLTGTVYVTDYIGAYDTSTSWNGAIQAAIDALEPAYGVRTTGLPEVGKVILPNLDMKITSTINLYSGITLEGIGSASELVEGAGFSGKQLITLSQKGGYIDDTKIKNIRLKSTTVRGIGVSDASGVIGGSVFEDITLDCVQGIILDAYTQSCLISNILSIGSVDTLLYVYGNSNSIKHVTKEGGTGTSIGAYIYLVDGAVAGTNVGNSLEHILIEGTCSANKSGMIFRNGDELVLRDYWYEANNSDGYMIRIEGCERVRIDGYFHAIDNTRKIKIDSTQYVLFDQLSSDAVPNSFYDCIEKDTSSVLLINSLHTRGVQSPYLLDKLSLNYIFNSVFARGTYTGGLDGYSPIYKPLFSGTNWLLNSSFEDSTNGWAFDDIPDTIDVQTSEVSNGNMLRLVNNGSGVWAMFQTFSIPASMVGQEITFSGLAKIESGTGWVTSLVSGAGITATTGYMRVNVNDGWGIVTQTFKPLSAGNIQIGFYFVNVIGAKIDNTYLTTGNGGNVNQADVERIISDSLATLSTASSLPLAGGTMGGSIVSEDVIPKGSLEYNLGNYTSNFDSLYVQFIKMNSAGSITTAAGSIIRIDVDHIEFRSSGGSVGGQFDFYSNVFVSDTMDARVILLDGSPLGSIAFDTTHIYIVTDSLAADIAAIEVGEFTIPDSVVYAGELTSGLAGKFNTADTTALHFVKLANKLDDSDTTSLLAMQWELDGKQATGLSVLKTDTTALHYTKLADKINYSDTTTSIAMQWELDGKLSSLPDSVVYTSEISGDTLITTADSLNILITQWKAGTLGGGLDSTNVSSLISDSLSTFTGGGLSEGDVNTLINTAIADLIDTSGYYVSKVEMFTASGAAMSVNPDSGDLLIINVSGMDNYTDEGGLRLVFTSTDSILVYLTTTTNGDFVVPVSMMAYVLALDSGATDFGIYSPGNGYINDQTATVITLKKGVLVSGSGSGMTDEQLQEHNFMWAYLQLDTTGSVTSIPAKTDIVVSTLTESDTFGVSANDVARVAVDSGYYKVKYDLSGTPTWTGWLTAEAYYKDIDSAIVRHTSGSTASDTSIQRFYVSNDVDTFVVITAGRDSVPNSYAFTDSTGAAVSTQIISKPLVLAGFDSAYVNVVGGDYKIGNVGSITRLATMIHVGDTLFAVDTSSATNEVKTNVAFTIGGVVDTFSVTTVTGGEEMETTRFLDALSTGLASGTETAIDSFIVMIKDSLVLDSLSQFFNAIYLHAIETEEASLKNLVKRSHDATEVNSDLIWTANEGWNGGYAGGTIEGTGYLDCNYNFATDSNNIAKKYDIGITLYIRQSDLTDTPWDAQPLYLCNDGEGGGVGGVVSLSTRRNDETMLLKINDDTFNGSLSNSGTVVGVYSLIRDGNTRTLFKNGASFFTETLAATGLPNAELWLFRNNVIGVVAGRSSPKQISITMVHKKLTLGQHQTLKNICEWWMDRWNKGVL